MIKLPNQVPLLILETNLEQKQNCSVAIKSTFAFLPLLFKHYNFFAVDINLH